jgi:LemA protein
VRAALIAIAVLLLLATGAGRKYSSVRAGLVRHREAMNQAWAQVDSALEKRAELVPGMVEAVKTVADGGNPVFQKLEDARTALLNGRSPEEKIQANELLNGALARLLLLCETYPRLKSSRDFALLQAGMSEAEDGIAVPRRKYNEALEHYNAQIQEFPENAVASMAGFARNDAYLKTEPGRAPMKAP